MAESRERDLELVLDLIDQRGAAPSGGVGVAGVREALLRKTVGTLCVTASFIEEHELDAEALVRLALRNGAEVEVVSAAAAARLNEVGGVGVLLRPPEGARTPAARPGVARPAGSSLSDSTLSI